MSKKPEPEYLLPADLEHAMASPLFLEVVPRAEARRVLVCSIGNRWRISPTGNKMYVERLAICDRTSPGAVAEIGARLNVEIEPVHATDADIRALIERAYADPPPQLS